MRLALSITGHILFAFVHISNAMSYDMCDKRFIKKSKDFSNQISQLSSTILKSYSFESDRMTPDIIPYEYARSILYSVTLFCLESQELTNTYCSLTDTCKENIQESILDRSKSYLVYSTVLSRDLHNCSNYFKMNDFRFSNEILQIAEQFDEYSDAVIAHFSWYEQ